MPSIPSDRHTVIVGGGLAGSSLAVLLATTGRHVTLLEQHRSAHHKVCGEFLSTEALHYLDLLGLDVESLGAQPITHVRLSTGRHVSRAALPFRARSLTRLALDEALLLRAETAGAHVLRGDPSTQLSRPTAATSWQLTLRSGAVLCADHAVLATGKHDLRGHPRPPGRQNGLLAFKQYFALQPREADALNHHVELHLFPGGYTGLQPVEPDADAAGAPHTQRANLCLLVEAALYRKLGGTWAAVLAHATAHSRLLQQRLTGSVALLPRPLALSHIPYGLTPAIAARADIADAHQPWRLGDQAAVIPSFTGDGMSIALHTAFCAARLLDAGGNPTSLAAALEPALGPQIRRATAVSQLLVTPAARPLAVAATPILPALLRLLARSTRIQNHAWPGLHAPAVREKIEA